MHFIAIYQTFSNITLIIIIYCSSFIDHRPRHYCSYCIIAVVILAVATQTHFPTRVIFFTEFATRVLITCSAFSFSKQISVRTSSCPENCSSAERRQRSPWRSGLARRTYFDNCVSQHLSGAVSSPAGSVGRDLNLQKLSMLNW